MNTLPKGDQMHLAHDIAKALHGLNNREQKSIAENQAVTERVLARSFTTGGFRQPAADLPRHVFNSAEDLLRACGWKLS